MPRAPCGQMQRPLRRRGRRSPLEDRRGVDVSQIRELLELSVAERAAEMISLSNMMIEAQERARRARELANMPQMLNLVTDFGEMDLTFTPAGSAGSYSGWRLHATEEEIGDGLIVALASLDEAS